MTNTSTKFVGGVSHDDARAFAHEIGVDAVRLQRQRPLHFFVHAKGTTDTGVAIKVPVGFMESKPQRSPAEMVGLYDGNRERYGVPIPENVDTTPEGSPEAPDDRNNLPPPDDDPTDSISDFNRP
jgi:hypothetical protein